MEFTGLSKFMCSIISFLTTEWVFYLGVIAVVLGGVALMSEEVKLNKWLSGLVMGLGIAVSAVTIVTQFVPNVANKCTTQASATK